MDEKFTISGMAETQIWQRIYAACMIYGHGSDTAVRRADEAVMHYRERMK